MDTKDLTITTTTTIITILTTITTPTTPTTMVNAAATTTSAHCVNRLLDIPTTASIGSTIDLRCTGEWRPTTHYGDAAAHDVIQCDDVMDWHVTSYDEKL